MIIREHYLKQIRDFYESDLIKIITGIRRSGKSTILNQVRNEIQEKTDNIIYLNFEDRAVSYKIRNDIDLINFIKAHRKEGKCYVFLDEIQLLENWNLACRSLPLDNISLFIIGSNSKLLSGEFIKELSGRYVSFRVKPFVYKELIEYGKELGKEVPVIDYLIYGGFPKILEFKTKEDIRLYLNDLNDTIVINDIVNRYKIRKTTLFERLVDYILVSNGRILSLNSIANYLKNEKIRLSLNSTIKYVDYLKEAFVINQIPQYSNKAKRKLDYFEKIYDEDVSFNSIRVLDQRFDLTHNLENVVYNELIYMGYELQVFKINEYEIDFLAIKGFKKYLIQVAYSIVDQKVYEREMRPFSLLDNSNKKIIITNDEIDFSTSTVVHLKLKDFLLMNDLEGI